ncbi:hypothetical protein ALC57_08579 [Trachymyrmex cornetzi]|uniref:Uncharacterized protein n=1 Tax=Trachymyrmex cornetzi TaxID=471704 RepID=A0A151J6S8_9HYME|nr:hypothetical protein ALC57_08579 [Trachymyrmex cornetzi]
MPPPYSPCLVKSPTGNVELKLQTYFSSYSHGRSRYKWASFAKASGLRAISILNSARRESVKFARKCECDSDTFGRYRSWTTSSRSVCTCSENRRDRHSARDPEWAPEWRFFENSKLNNIHSLVRPSYVVKRKTSYSKQSNDNSFHVYCP